MTQAENAVDQMDWIEKITGVIASLLTFQGTARVSEKSFSFVMPILVTIYL